MYMMSLLMLVSEVAIFKWILTVGVFWEFLGKGTRTADISWSKRKWISDVSETFKKNEEFKESWK